MMTTLSINAANRAIEMPISAKAVAKARLYFIDNLRILLITLVVLLHLSITYGHGGGWYYYEGQPDDLTTILLTMFNAVNQAFFMGFFFMISAYFTPGSYDRKGARLFLKDRLLRLGIPLLFYMIIIEPLLVYVLMVNVDGFEGSVWRGLARYFETHYLENIRLGVGPLWFVETLLIFAAIYVLWQRLAKPGIPVPSQRDEKVPGNMAIAMFALALGVVSFIVRIWLPIGWNFDLLNLQFPYFPQYIALFALGLMAYRRNWFMSISEATGKLWRNITIALIVLFPAMIIFGGADDPTPFMGSVHWQALALALWEQLLCMAMIITLLVWFRQRFNHQSNLTKTMSDSVYTVYIIHAPVAVMVALALQDLSLYPLIKFPLVALIVVPLCFWLATFIRKLPLARNIL
ncbi:MAG: acyltransferase family protein [Anaerolineae bacterium]|nr:acyltransferase family protein [Anaerolineae bacterium]